MAKQLLVDLYNCNRKIIDDLDAVQRISRAIIKEIGADIVEECSHKFEPIGISYIAVITTSHFSIHTWPEFGYAAVDIFSCKEEVPNQIALELQKAFMASKVNVKKIERDIEGGD